MTVNNDFQEFVKTIEKLRDPKNGCPWDLKQTHQSLVKYLIEETFEAVFAIDSQNANELKEELGDVLLQVVLHSVIAEQNGDFNISDVIQMINQKMIRRHPHVFENLAIKNEDEIKFNWEKIKLAEKISSSDKNYTFGKHSLSNTSLLCAEKIGQKTQRLDFDWNSAHEVVQKVEEELTELLDIMNSSKKDKIEEEFGDLLFSMAQLGRHLEINSENALRKANEKFIRRFSAMEDLLANENKKIDEVPRSEKEDLWKQVKLNEQK